MNQMRYADHIAPMVHGNQGERPAGRQARRQNEEARVEGSKKLFVLSLDAWVSPRAAGRTVQQTRGHSLLDGNGEKQGRGRQNGSA